MGILILFRVYLLVYFPDGLERRINIDSLYKTNTVNTVNTVKNKMIGKRSFFMREKIRHCSSMTKSEITVSRGGHDFLTKNNFENGLCPLNTPCRFAGSSVFTVFTVFLY